jgi:prevent-host-death family protein
MVILLETAMRSVQITEAKAKLSGLLAEVEAGETIKIMRRGRVIARLVPERPEMAADAFRPFWASRDEIDLEAPDDAVPEPNEAW